MTRRRRPRAVAVVPALGLLLGIAGLVLAPGTAGAGAPVPLDFYTPPPLHGTYPGEVLKNEPTTIKAEPTGLVGVPVTARRIMYVSTDQHGAPVPVTGTVITPRAAWHGPGARPVVGYAIGTQGLADRCAPSKQLAAGTEYESPFLELMLAKGWALAVTDYPGLGTPGDHPYVQRIDLGHAVLDSVRAARNLTVGGVSRSAPVLISGYSEGGTAAAGALELQPTYAPDVKPVAGFVGDEAADFAGLAKHLEGNLQAFLLGYTTIGLRETRPDLDIDALLSPFGRKVFAQLDRTCVEDAIVEDQVFPDRLMTADGSTILQLTRTPKVAAALRAMNLGSIAPTVPVLVGHSVGDEILPYSQGIGLAREWCAKGADVKFVRTLVPEHIGGAAGLYPVAIQYLSRALKGELPASNCGSLG